ncbi:MAG: F0F1 ATP synthase subunit B [Oscillospiraceae bacterium]|jgi:F-type H+-transporting ATPase subunit b|nr:F0F1 ATP synthase subunit B [Oscillospiraceae bacterium]
MGAFLSLVSIDVGTIIFSLINTLLIFLMYKHFLHGKVVVMLENRAQAVSAEMKAAEDAKLSAQQKEEEYKALLADSRAEAEKIISSAAEKAQARETEIISGAENAASLIRKKAEEEVERERKRTINEIKNQIAELVIMTASAVAEKEIDESGNAALIESFLVRASDVEN